MRIGRGSAARRVILGTVGAVGAVLVLATSGCSVFDRGDKTDGVSVFDVKVGQCFQVPEDITVELTDLPSVPCTTEHEQEAYARVAYTDPGTGSSAGATPDDFPGDAALKSFADGACAAEFADYVGVDYRDSTLYFTYLVPSPRGWEQNSDRSVLCFVTTTGATLTASVKGTGW
ncbi:septum formation family protein [Cellulomonas sp. PhB150]|uniref:septum formation family protein n=1 Tax=Cellulomonas sp. PhB150 TaxID=2485188 RepID=UPI000F466F95|nr:septum formation family protein [Cellulomonas sp. PhB150]ROS21769.1 putative regulator of septum formation [Cellulomonas sp. PhB150]